jgi:hypothetical protein
LGNDRKGFKKESGKAVVDRGHRGEGMEVVGIGLVCEWLWLAPEQIGGDRSEWPFNNAMANVV